MFVKDQEELQGEECKRVQYSGIDNYNILSMKRAKNWIIFIFDEAQKKIKEIGLTIQMTKEVKTTKRILIQICRKILIKLKQTRIVKTNEQQMLYLIIEEVNYKYLHCIQIRFELNLILMFLRRLLLGGLGVLPVLRMKQERTFQIRRLSSAQQLGPQDIKNKSLICYQMSGNKVIDEKVNQIACQFVQKYETLLSQNFEIVFLPTGLNKQQDEQPSLVIFKKDDMEVLSLQPYLRKNNTKKLFHRLITEINQFEEVGLQNISEIVSSLEYRKSTLIVSFPEDSNQESVRKCKRKLRQYMQNNDVVEKEAQVLILKDQQSQRIFGLNATKLKTQPNQIYIISPVSQNLRNSKKEENYSINGNKYTIMKAQIDEIEEKLIFSPVISKHSNNLILRANVDLNYDQQTNMHKLYQQFKDLKGVNKIMSFGENPEGKALKVTLQNNNFDQIVKVYQAKTLDDLIKTKKLLLQSHSWLYNGPLQSQMISKWIQQVKDHPQYQNYKTENTPNTNFNSKKIVGEQYLNILRKPVDKVIFHYSKSCHSCKKFGGLYQELAKQAQKWQNRVQFYRIDNDANKIEGIRNFNSTPIFVMYKKDQPMIPFIYKQSFFTKKLFQDYIKITQQIKPFSFENIDQLVKLRKQNESKMQDLL